MRSLWLGVLCFVASGVGLAQTGAAHPDAVAHIGKGYELVQDERFAEAAQEFRSALAVDPGAVKARYQLAVCLFALGEQAESRKEFERLLSETGSDPSVEYYLARLDLLSGDAAGAIRRLAPLMAKPPFPDAAFYLGSAYLTKGVLGDAIRWLRKAGEQDPRDFRSHYRLARALQQKGLRAEAEHEYAVSTELREHYNESAKQAVACVQALHAGSGADASQVCNRMFDRNDPDTLTTLGMLFGNNGRFEEAIAPLQRAAELDPDSFEVWHNLGVTYFRLKRFTDARAPLERAVSLRPDYFGSNALLGATLYMLKEDDAAYRVLHFAHQLKPEDADTGELLFRICVILGNRAAAGGDYASGLQFLAQAAKLRPGDERLASRIAEVRGLAGKEK